MNCVRIAGHGRATLVAMLSTCLLAGATSAQETRGTIQGRLLDGTGAVIPGAQVSATNVATNVSAKTTTNTEGAYTLSFLLPGIYSLTAGAAGFNSARRENIELRIHDRLLIDLVLEVGAVTETVEVTGQAPLLEAATATIGQVMDARRIAELPTPCGSPVSLVYLTPGVINTYPGGLTCQQPTDIQASITLITVNGAPQGSTDFTLDGVPNTQTSMADRGVGISNSPPTDMVQEFKIETAMDASVGHTSGAVMNFSLKTGTNTPHGTAYTFLRDPSWNANNFFANRAGQPKGDFSSLLSKTALANLDLDRRRPLRSHSRARKQSPEALRTPLSKARHHGIGHDIVGGTLDRRRAASETSFWHGRREDRKSTG